MTDTALKFGPEWLRALTEPQGGGGNINASISVKRPAGYRTFGKEELLAIFIKDVKPPEELCTFDPLFVEKCQYPVNLKEWTEEEKRAMKKGANSDTSIRPYMSSSGKRPPSPSSAGRGRVRGRGGGNSLTHFERNRSMDDDFEMLRGPHGDRGGFLHNGGRGRSTGFERHSNTGWFDNGAADDGGVSGSPRKGYTRAPFDDWRGTRNSDAAAGGSSDKRDDGWRSTTATRKWGPNAAAGGPAAWRNGDRDSANYGRAKFSDAREAGRGSTNDRWRRDDEAPKHHVPSRSMAVPGRRRKDSEQLPEWANEDPSANGDSAGGCFDDSGKFRAEEKSRANIHPRKNRDEWGEQERWDDVEVDPDDVKDARSSEDSGCAVSPDAQAMDKVISAAEELTRNESDGPTDAFVDEQAVLNGKGNDQHRECAVNQQDERAKDDMEALAGNLVSSLVDEEESKTPPPNNPDEMSVPTAGLDGMPPATCEQNPAEISWTYLDPQGQMQGPFNSEEMLEWFNGGYFPNDLMVRRSRDARFITLTDMTKLYGRCPFMPGPAPGPLNNQMEERLKQQQQQQLLQIQHRYMLQQQMIAQQQQQQQHFLALQQRAAALAAATGQPHQANPAELSKLLFNNSSLGHLGSLGGLHGPLDMVNPGGVNGTNGMQPDLSRRNFGNDPLRNLLNIGGGGGLDQPDPLKQLLMRNQLSQPQLSKPQAMGGVDVGLPIGSIQAGQHRGPTPPSTTLPSNNGLPVAVPEPTEVRGPAQPNNLMFGVNENNGMDYPPASGTGPDLQGGSNSPLAFPIGGVAQPQHPHPLPQHTPPPPPQPAHQQVNEKPKHEYDAIQSLLQQLQNQSAAGSIRQSSGSPLAVVTAPAARDELPTGSSAIPIPSSNMHIHSVFSDSGHQQQPTKPLEDFGQKNSFQSEKPSPSMAVTSIWDTPQAEPADAVSEPPARIAEQGWDAEPSHPEGPPAEQSAAMLAGRGEAAAAEDATPAEPSVFVTPKQLEKKEKRNKKAEEKRKAKEAKKAQDVLMNQPYIPGMPGSVQPEEQVLATHNILDQKQEEKAKEQAAALAHQKAQQEALAKLAEEQKAKLRRQELERIRDEKLAKLAPWAKVKNGHHDDQKKQLSLAEIQKLEAEKERKAREAREQAENRAREEARRREEEERQARAAKQVNWALAAAPSAAPTAVKSLAEIQAEEARVEREKQERERSQRVKETGHSGGGGNWKSSGGPTSWANKIAANQPSTANNRTNNNAWANVNGVGSANVVAPEGFWEPVVSNHNQANNNSNNKQQSNNNNKKQKGANKKDSARQAANNQQNRQERNGFDEWCTKALEALNAQVDIPTFLSFLKDIESPFEVHDYVKTYVGEGKEQKKFATNYLERRSRWKNALKNGGKYEDDLTTPANAINPGEGDFQEAGKKGKKKNKNSKSNLNHLLGFSVQGQGVNRGELDIPQ